MKLHAITITASSNAEPETVLSFAWQHGDALADLEQALVFVQDYINSLREPASKAASANPPLPPPL